MAESKTVQPIRAAITQRGTKLSRAIRCETYEIQKICSLICRLAVTHHRIQEDWCCKEMTDREIKRTERREAGIEKRIGFLAGQIPGVETVLFSGDPRGATVKLVMQDKSLHDDWGRQGVCALQ